MWRSGILLIMCLFGAPLAVQSAHYRHDGKYALPDAKVTPGAVEPSAVADVSRKPHMVDGIEFNICARDFRTAPIRKRATDFSRLKKDACKAYGVTKCDRSVEGDHLVSLELGGCPDCESNVWPQPMGEAKIKDHKVEDQLPKLVCAGKMTLPAAQQCVADDWVSCEKKIAVLER